MSGRYVKPTPRKEVVLQEIPIPKDYQREVVAALFESAYCKGPDEILDALRKCAETTDTGKHALQGTNKEPVALHAMIGQFHDLHGKTALHYACLGGRAANVEYILKLCPSIAPMKDSEGETALMLASLKGEELLVNAILHFDKAINATNTMGVTALHLAAESGSTTCIRVLIESGAEDLIAELLLAHKADPNLRDKQSWSALQCAAEAGAYRIARCLIEANANPDVITEGVTAFDLAMEHYNWAIADLLKDRMTVFVGGQHAVWMNGLRTACAKRMQLDHERQKRQAQAAAGIKDAAALKQLDDAKVLKAEGDAYNQAGDCVLAADKYTQALKVLPDLPATDKERAALHASRSMMYLTFGDLVAAEEDANMATQLDPLWSKGYSAKARVYKAKRESDQYTKHLYEALIREEVRDEELMYVQLEKKWFLHALCLQRTLATGVIRVIT